jgi:hypothetical protein
MPSKKSKMRENQEGKKKRSHSGWALRLDKGPEGHGQGSSCVVGSVAGPGLRSLFYFIFIYSSFYP